MKYINGEQIKVGDYITDNCSYRKTKTLEAKGYVDKNYNIVDSKGNFIINIVGFIDYSNGGISRLTLNK